MKKQLTGFFIKYNSLLNKLALTKFVNTPTNFNILSAPKPEDNDVL